MAPVQSFPLLSTTEFEQACTNLVQAFDLQSDEEKVWLSVELIDRYNTKYLRITKPLPALIHEPENTIPPSVNMNQEIEENDEELLPTNLTPHVVIEYDIILSPSYQVPVLYFSIRDPGFRFPPTMETLYQHVIPPQYTEQARSVGVVGGITVTDHPYTNLPVFFIHPCQTSAILETTCNRGAEKVNPWEYLMIWIGSLGGYVGLSVSLSLSVALEKGPPSSEVSEPGR